MVNFKKVILFITVLALSWTLAMGQGTTANVIGTVTGPDGAPIPGVLVEATSVKLVGKATAVTNEYGIYRLVNLPPGTYTLKFSSEGFQTVTRADIALQIEQTLKIDQNMQMGKIETVIEVTGVAPLIDVKSQAQDIALKKEVFQNLPKGRDFTTLLTTVPGVANEDMLNGISVDGASGAENMFYVDGTNTTNLVNGTSGQSVSFDFAEEVQFKASGYNAEYGGSVGGVLNVVTRSGGNEFHGEVIGYYEGSKLQGNLRKQLTYKKGSSNKEAAYYDYDVYAGKVDWYQIEGGLNLGGYIVKDKVWFFGTFMPKYYSQDRNLDYSFWTDNKSQDKTINRNRQWWNMTLKLTTQLTSSIRFGASFVNNFYKYKGVDQWSYNANAATNYELEGYSYPNMSGSAYTDINLGNNAMINLRGGYFKMNQNNPLIDPQTIPTYYFQMEQPYNYQATNNNMFPEIPAALQHGDNWNSYPASQARDLKQDIKERININADFSYFFNAGGEHSLKAGIQFIRQGENTDNRYVQPVVYVAWDQELSILGTDYGRGKYGWYAVRGNDKTGSYGSLYKAYANNWAIYAQDSWTIGNKLTLNFGIRTESEYIPNYSSDPLFKNVKKPVKFDFADKISPRFGFVYDVNGDSSFKIFGSFNILQDVMKLYMAANAFGGFKWISAYYTLDDYDFTKIGVNGNYPGTYLTTNDWRKPAFNDVQPDMKPFTQREIAIGFEKKLMENISLSVRVVNKNVLQAIEDVAVVLPTPEGVVESYLFCNPGSDWLKKKWQESKDAGFTYAGAPDHPKAKRDYWGVNIGLEKRLSNNWMAGFNYTWSRLTGNYSGLANSDELGRNSPNGERAFDLWWICFDKTLKVIDGALPTDRTHVVKFYGSYMFPFGLTIGTVINAMSGTPLTQEWNVDSLSYFPYNRANMGRTPFLWFANAYAEYNLKIGKSTLNFNVNVDNVFDVDTAQRVRMVEHRGNMSPGEARLVANNWTYQEFWDKGKITADPRYKKEYQFYDPIAVRFGIRFMF